MTDEKICPNCGGPLRIRNPTGACDHLYYPDYMTSSALEGASTIAQERDVGKWRKKPVVVDAWQFVGFNDIPEWFGNVHDETNNIVASACGEKYYISTLEGIMTAGPLDWIVKGVKGELYPVKPDIFEATYERAFTTSPKVPAALRIAIDDGWNYYDWQPGKSDALRAKGQVVQELYAHPPAVPEGWRERPGDTAMHHGKPCAICGEAVDNLTDNPMRWSVPLPVDGISKPHHTGCVLKAMHPAEGWRDISTAPKDGTPVQLFHEGMHGMRRYSIRYWATNGDWRIDGKRVSEGWSDEWRQLRGDLPTHWQPLPSPPYKG